MFRKTLIMFIVIILVGCKSTGVNNDAFSRVVQLQKLGNYEEALARMDMLLAENPNEVVYLNKRDELVNNLIRPLISQARAVLGNGLNSYSDVEQVNNLLKRARNYKQDSTALSDLTREVDAATDSFYRMASDRMLSVESLLSSNNWTEAFYELSDLLNIFPEVEGGYEAFDKIQYEGLPKMINEARMLLSHEKIPEALELATVSNAVDPDNYSAETLLAEAQEKYNPEYYRNAIVSRLEEKSWERVISLCHEVRRSFTSLNPLCSEVLVKVDAGRQYEAFKRAQRLSSQNRLFGAYEEYAKARAISAGAVTQEMLTFEYQLMEKLTNKANELIKQDKIGTAWVLLNRVNNFESRYEMLKKLEDRITARVTKQIAIHDFESPRDEVDAGSLFANNLASNIHKIISNDINIVEREALNKIIEEQKLAQVGISDSDRLEAGKVLGVDINIMGKVLRYKVEDEEAESSKAAKIKIGSETVQNIEYQNWKARNPNAKGDELKAAPPAFVERDKFESISYKVKSVKKVGFVEVSFRILKNTGETVTVQTLEKSKTFEDVSNEGNELAGIKFDPLEIPTNTEVLKDITRDVIDELVKYVLNPLQNGEVQYLNSGDGFVARKEYINASEEYVNAIFNARLKNLTGTPVITQANDKIEMYLTEFQF